VHIINGNSIDIIPKIQHVDIIYVDPPWGGKTYKESDLLKLTLGDIQIEELVKSWFSTDFSPKCIVFKLPKNYDIRYFFDSLNNQEIPQFKVFLYEIRKLFIIVVERNEVENKIEIKSDQ
jgi:adenine-specific DNA methylase